MASPLQQTPPTKNIIIQPFDVQLTSGPDITYKPFLGLNYCATASIGVVTISRRSSKFSCVYYETNKAGKTDLIFSFYEKEKMTVTEVLTNHHVRYAMNIYESI